MRAIPKTLRDEMALEPYYHRCARVEMFNDHTCTPDPLTGRLIEWEHAFIYAGEQINEKWAIIPLCFRTHRGGMLNKNMNHFIALSRATPEDLEKYPRTDWKQLYLHLAQEYLPKSLKCPVQHGPEGNCTHPEDCDVCAALDEIHA